MTLAVMQPYLFPYLGYFQLIEEADRFVLYDDVTYIKQGWINRNRILVNGSAHLFTLPLRKASSFAPIDSIELDPLQFPAWREKFLRTLQQAYARAPQFTMAHALIANVLHTPAERLVDLLRTSIVSISEHMGIRTTIIPTARPYANQVLHGQARIIDICKQEKASRYVNAVGGTDLYSRTDFAQQGIELMFLRSRLPAYAQGTQEFVPGLSIIDALMRVSTDELHGMLHERDLV